MPAQKGFQIADQHGSVISRGGDGQPQFFFRGGLLDGRGLLERDGLPVSAQRSAYFQLVCRSVRGLAPPRHKEKAESLLMPGNSK